MTPGAVTGPRDKAMSERRVWSITEAGRQGAKLPSTDYARAVTHDTTALQIDVGISPARPKAGRQPGLARPAGGHYWPRRPSIRSRNRSA